MILWKKKRGKRKEEKGKRKKERGFRLWLGGHFTFY